MYGNCRKPKDKSLYESYRCDCRKHASSNRYNNTEIKKEYIEEFVLSESEKNILNDKAILILVEKINQHIKKQSKIDKALMEILAEELGDIDKHINNIVVKLFKGLHTMNLKQKWRN